MHNLFQKWGLHVQNQTELLELWCVLQKTVQSHSITISCENYLTGNSLFSLSLFFFLILFYCLGENHNYLLIYLYD